uniref:VP6 n=1 Tax=Japanaut virus TaxID=2547358 RepID=A0A482A661_9REOV|nr:VP6 [Japanaut virus]
MSAFVLLVPGDLIQAIVPDLESRGIKYKIKSWSDVGQNQAVAGTEKKGEEAGDSQTEKVNIKGHTGDDGSTAKGEGAAGADATGGDRTDKDENRIQKGDAKSAPELRWSVLTSEIADAIRKMSGSSVSVITKEGKDQNVIVIGRGLAKELGLGREELAIQKEELKEYKGVKGMIGKVEEVQSMKKLLMRTTQTAETKKDVPAKQSGVSLVSNDVLDVERATAYFTAPTGDTNWKEVARKASERRNIMAYSSTGEESQRDLIHLIDHI